MVLKDSLNMANAISLFKKWFTGYLKVQGEWQRKCFFFLVLIWTFKHDLNLRKIDDRKWRLSLVAFSSL